MSPEITVEKIVAVGTIKTKSRRRGKKDKEHTVAFLKSTDGGRYALMTDLLPKDFPPIAEGSVVIFPSTSEQEGGLKIIKRGFREKVEILPPKE